MMKRALVLISMVGLGFLFAWGASEDTSKQKAELESLKTELQQLKPNIEKAENEKSALEVEIAVVQRNREQLQQQVDEYISSRQKLLKQVEKLTFTCEQSRQQLDEIVGERDELKQRITELTVSRDELQRELAELTTLRNRLERQVDELTMSRNAAAVRSQTAQDIVDKLSALVDTETEGIGKQQQNETTIANQAKEDAQAPVIKVSEDPNVLTTINWPPVVSSQADERPICHSFNASRPHIIPGQTSILIWQVSNAESIRIEPGIGPVSDLDSRAVKPVVTTTYTLIATNQAGESKITCRVEVDKQLADESQTIEQPAVPAEIIEPPVISSDNSEPKVENNEVVEPVVIVSEADEGPTCHSFDTTHPRIMPGQTSTLSWQVSNAENIRIEPDIGRVSSLGSRAVKPDVTTTYTLIAMNQAGESRITCGVEVGEQPTVRSQVNERPAVLTEVIEPPVISSRAGERPTCHSFNAARPQIMPGQTSILSWQVSNAESIRIEPGIGRVSALGSRAVGPTTTTIYTLIAANKAGESRVTCRVEISKHTTIFSADSIHSRALLEEYKASDDDKVLPGQKLPVSDPNSKPGKFLGYRSRKDESGKFIFIPVYEKEQEK